VLSPHVAETSTKVPRERGYDSIAKAYDALAGLYSLGGIARAKRAHLVLIQPGQRVLYVGAGSGEECVEAARIGARVTILDSSQQMLSLCRARLQKQERLGGTELAVTLVRADVRKFYDRKLFDVVVVPFFLNTLEERELPDMIVHLGSYLRHAGQLISVDFRAPSAHPGFRLIQKAYYLPPLALFYSLTQNPWHPLYDYEKIRQKAALPLTLRQRIVTPALGLPLFETLCWETP
jgi:ubiquinone/menaquinone biosynthesis C-methylase UbiE